MGMRTMVAITITTITTALLLFSAPSIAGADDRFPTRGVRAHAVGCWALTKDQQLVITEFGKHSVKARLDGAAKSTDKLAPWNADAQAFEVVCQGATNADTFCLASPEGNQLRVRTFQVQGATSKEIDSTLVARCPAPAGCRRGTAPTRP